jgi:2-dehydro-3-deoxyphosphogluconate aldolase / (4S)-4-hydroxy-2-oxoglutarate aldolase
MTKDEVRSRIVDVGIIPVLQTWSLDEARFVAGALIEGGIPILELSVLEPRAIETLGDLVRACPNALIGAGTIRDRQTARHALDAGAEFLVTPDVGLDTIKLGMEANKLVMAGALTASEVLIAWNAGADLVKIFPCAQVGGPHYIKALRGPFPDIPLVPTGGVNLNTAGDFIQAGAAALGVGAELVMKQAIKSRAHDVIRDMARRFASAVSEARTNMPHPNHAHHSRSRASSLARS